MCDFVYLVVLFDYLLEKVTKDFEGPGIGKIDTNVTVGTFHSCNNAELHECKGYNLCEF